jgi:hypothetical protein
MAYKEPKISKQEDAGASRHITLTIPKNLIQLGSLEVLHASVIMEACEIGILTIQDKEKITCKKLGQYRCCLINEIPNILASSSHIGARIKKLLHKNLNLSGL